MAAVRHSRYEFASVEKDDLGRLYLDVPDPPVKTTLLRGAARTTLGEGDTLWTLAWRGYRAILNPIEDLRPSGFWFVVAWANDIVDATAGLELGAVAFVPSLETLFGEVLVPPAFNPQNTTT